MITFRFWENLCHCSATPTSVGQNEIILSKFRSTVLARDNVSASLSTTGQRALDLPVDSEPFDWQHKVAAVEPLPTFVRPGKPESPVNINFDHSQAAFGKLGQLGNCYIVCCCDAPHFKCLWPLLSL